MENDNLKMFCLTLEPQHLKYIKDLNYTPVGLGEKKFPDNCVSDKNAQHNPHI